LDDPKSDSIGEDEVEEEELHTSVLRRSMRERRKLERYSPHDFHANFVLSITNDDPGIVREEMNLENSKLWKKAMVEEMHDLDKNEDWNLVEFPTRRKAIGRKWVFKKKLNA
jgi:hypothetical protein